jgi:hypothetical protein
MQKGLASSSEARGVVSADKSISNFQRVRRSDRVITCETHDDLTFANPNAERVLVPEGWYQLMRCTKVSKRFVSKKWKKAQIHVAFTQMLPDFDEAPIEVVAFYNVPPDGRAPGTESKFYEHWKIANGNRAPRRTDRMSARIFADKVFDVRVETVKVGSNGKMKDEAEWYSIVREIRLADLQPSGSGGQVN